MHQFVDVVSITLTQRTYGKTAHMSFLSCITRQKATDWVAFQKAPRTGLEPVTYQLTAGRSTIELSRNVFVLLERLQYTINTKFRQYLFSQKFVLVQSCVWGALQYAPNATLHGT